MTTLLLMAVMMVMVVVPVPGAKSKAQVRQLLADTIPTDTLLPDAIPTGVIHLGAMPTDSMPNDSLLNDTIHIDTAAGPDTLAMDSLELAIYHYNKAIDDSLRLDSLNRAKPNGIEAPVTFSAKDSLVYDAISKDAYLYGETNVDYQEMNLTS
ncbi:MAG: hypothetical protein J6Y23_13580, partial [Prevotella sp.]|nr:hypothetical protein [Prevotella sp.]